MPSIRWAKGFVIDLAWVVCLTMIVVWIFKTKRYIGCGGVTQFFLLVSMLIFSVSLPIMINLAQKNQENRSKATEIRGNEPAYLVLGLY